MQQNTPIASVIMSKPVAAANTVLRNTYMLLGFTLVFSAITAGIAMMSNALPMNPLFIIVGYFGLLFTTQSLRNSGWGLVAIFALTGFMGYTLGPILNYYVHSITNGTQIIMMALGGTGLIFFSLSAYVLTTRKNLSAMTGFIVAGSIVGLMMMVGALFIHIPMYYLAISGFFALFSCAIILYQTSAIIHGGETNYIMATITLYVSLYNIFLFLLRILGSRR